MEQRKLKKVMLLVAHPDDETLWAGGTILSNPTWQCFIVCLCRKNDAERASRFFKALKVLHADGIMGNMDDGPDQIPLEGKEIEQMILKLIPATVFDLIITHNPSGEYTKHLRHEEISNAVINLWAAGSIVATELWTFAYEDGKRSYYPKAQTKADLHYHLTQTIYDLKYNIITQTYGFKKNSWEANTTPAEEAFWHFSNPSQAKQWLTHKGIAI